MSSSTFIREIEIPELHPAQAQVKAQAKRFNVVNCGRRWGKNVLAHEVCVDAAIDGAPVGWGSPTYKNLADDWRTLIEILAPITRDKSEQDRRIELVTNGVLEMWSLDNPEVIRGRAYKRFIFNEAASVATLMGIWNNIVRPTLVDLKGDAWWYSSPRWRNGFYNLHVLGRGNDPDYKSWTFTSYANPHLDPEELDAMRTSMSEREYRQEILAEFLEDEGSVFRNIDACMHSPVTTPAEHEGHVIVAGVDWAKHADFTAISIGCATCRREIFLDRFNQIDYAFQRGRVQAAFHKWAVTHGIGELNAMGEPIIEQLQRDGVHIIGHTTTSSSKMAIIEGLSLELEKGSIQFQANDEAKAELEAYERKETKTGLATYSAPEGMHDDTVIARALMVKAMNESPAKRQQSRPPSKQYQQAVSRIF